MPPGFGPGDWNDRVWKGSFLTRTSGGAAYRMHMNEPWLGEAAFLVNEDDGSYYTEAQLRRHMRLLLANRLAS